MQRRLDAVARGDLGFGIIEHEHNAVGKLGAGSSGDTIEIFYALIPSVRGKGLVTTAAAALVSALEAFKITVALATNSDNIASRNTARRAGFQVFGSETRVIKGHERQVLTWTRPT